MSTRDNIKAKALEKVKTESVDKKVKDAELVGQEQKEYGISELKEILEAAFALASSVVIILRNGLGITAVTELLANEELRNELPEAFRDSDMALKQVRDLTASEVLDLTEFAVGEAKDLLKETLGMNG